MNEDRISVLYGKNGSGKSTISNTVRKAKGDVVDDIVQATLLDEKIWLLWIRSVFMCLMKIM